MHVLFDHIKRSYLLRWESALPARTMIRKTPARQLITKKIPCPRPALLRFSTAVTWLYFLQSIFEIKIYSWVKICWNCGLSPPNYVLYIHQLNLVYRSPVPVRCLEEVRPYLPSKEPVLHYAGSQHWHQRQVLTLTPLFFHFSSVFGHEYRIYRSYCARPYAYPHISLTAIFADAELWATRWKRVWHLEKWVTTYKFHGQIMDHKRSVKLRQRSRTSVKEVEDITQWVSRCKAKGNMKNFSWQSAASDAEVTEKIAQKLHRFLRTDYLSFLFTIIQLIITCLCRIIKCVHYDW